MIPAKVIRFNGENYESMKAWKRAFPLYAAYAEDVRDGADSVLKLETLRHRRRETSKGRPIGLICSRKGAGQ